ncbi:unnamed protein product, partial [Prorocentrum cordatum]
MGNVSFANEAEPLNIASGGIDCGSATNTARSSPPSTSWISPCIQSGLSLYRGKMKEKQKQVIRDDVFDMFLNVLELLLGYLVLFAQTLPEDAELPPIRRKRNTQTQLILDFPENMGKYGKWAGRQKPRKYGKIWGIILFVCIYLCVSGPLQSRSCGWTVARGTARAGQGGRARDRAASHGEVAERRRRRRRASTSTSPRRMATPWSTRPTSLLGGGSSRTCPSSRRLVVTERQQELSERFGGLELDPVLGSGAVVLMDAEWMVERDGSDGIFEPRQALPPIALMPHSGGKAATQDIERFRQPLLHVACICWLDRTSPPLSGQAGTPPRRRPWGRPRACGRPRQEGRRQEGHLHLQAAPCAGRRPSPGGFLSLLSLSLSIAPSSPLAPPLPSSSSSSSSSS